MIREVNATVMGSKGRAPWTLGAGILGLGLLLAAALASPVGFRLALLVELAPGAGFRDLQGLLSDVISWLVQSGQDDLLSAGLGNYFDDAGNQHEHLVPEFALAGQQITRRERPSLAGWVDGPDLHKHGGYDLPFGGDRLNIL